MADAADCSRRAGRISDIVGRVVDLSRSNGGVPFGTPSVEDCYLNNRRTPDSKREASATLFVVTAVEQQGEWRQPMGRGRSHRRLELIAAALHIWRRLIPHRFAGPVAGLRVNNSKEMPMRGNPALERDQVRLVMDAAAAQEVFAKRQRLGEDVIAYAHTIKIRALGRLGELLKQLSKATGGQRGGRGRKIDGSRKEPSIQVPTLADLGVSKKVAFIANQLAALPPSTREASARSEKRRIAVQLKTCRKLPACSQRMMSASAASPPLTTPAMTGALAS